LANIHLRHVNQRYANVIALSLGPRDRLLQSLDNTLANGLALSLACCLLHGRFGYLLLFHIGRPIYAFLGYLEDLTAGAADLFYHVLAELYAPSFGGENASGLRNDWPRIPLPATKSLLLASAALGRELAALLDPEIPAPKGAAYLTSIGPVSSGEGTLDPDAGDLELTAGWGHAGKGGVTMPAKGKIQVRDMTAAERGKLPGGALAILGGQACDVWLNDRAYWRNIPLRVWEYTLGGYQVIKKWLSYREKDLLGGGCIAQ
jgi:hypothetical protein